MPKRNNSHGGFGYRLSDCEHFVADLAEVPQLPKGFFYGLTPYDIDIRPDKEAEADAIVERAREALRRQRIDLDCGGDDDA